jgi:Zn-dependent protease
LNLLPIPPLDGGRILIGVLPGPASYSLSRLEPYGLFIVVLLLVTGVLDSMMRPLIDGAVFVITALLGR